MPAEGNVGVAFALVIGAGLCTTLGALAAFFAKLAAPRALAIGLSVSAGVMIYVSFVEIFMTKGVPALEDGGWSENNAYRFGTLLFFAGMLVTFLLDMLVHFFSSFAGKNEEHDPHTITEIPRNRSSLPRSTTAVSVTKGSSTLPIVAQPSSEAVVDMAPVLPPSKDIEAGEYAASSAASGAIAGDGDAGPTPEHDGTVHLAHKPEDMPEDAAAVVDLYVTNDDHRFGLQKMGVMTALAIGVHNLPEGLATFVAALADPLNGVAIAIAIALHNIPEGVCVAMPVYYATGSRWKGFWWAFLSGVSEPLGGLLGYLVLYGNRMSDVAYGVLFCVVAGMMVYISIKELIPTALKFDEHNKVVTSGLVFGMAVIAASLLMFTI